MLWQYQRCIVVGDEQLLVHIPRIIPLGHVIQPLDLLDVNPRHTVQHPDGVAVIVGQGPQGLCGEQRFRQEQVVFGAEEAAAIVLVQHIGRVQVDDGVMITHHYENLEELDRVYRLEDGRIVECSQSNQV